MVLKARLHNHARPIMRVRRQASDSRMASRVSPCAARDGCLLHHAQKIAPCRRKPQALPATAHHKTRSPAGLPIARNARMLRGTADLARPTRYNCPRPHAAQSREMAYSAPIAEKAKRKIFMSTGSFAHAE